MFRSIYIIGSYICQFSIIGDQDKLNNLFSIFKGKVVVGNDL